MSKRTRSRNAFETSLNGSITAGATTITLTSVTGLIAPGYLIIEPKSGTLREVIKYAGISSNDLTGCTRGLAGSASGAQAHANGVIIRAAPFHQHLDDIFDDIEALEAADTGHFGGTDIADHPEATGAVRGFMSAADKSKLDGVATGAVADHGALTGLADDDHSQYHTDARAVTWHDADDHSGLAAGDLPAHTHESVAQAGKLDHGLALNGLADDDHTQYHNTARHDADDHSNLEETVEFAEIGVLTVKTGTFRWYPPYNITIVDVSASVGTAPTGAAILIDVNKNGTTIFTTGPGTNRPNIAVSTFFDVSGAPDVTSLLGDTDYLTVDIDQIGSTIAGSDLVVQVRYTRA